MSVSQFSMHALAATSSTAHWRQLFK